MTSVQFLRSHYRKICLFLVQILIILIIMKIFKVDELLWAEVSGSKSYNRDTRLNKKSGHDHYPTKKGKDYRDKEKNLKTDTNKIKENEMKDLDDKPGTKREHEKKDDDIHNNKDIKEIKTNENQKERENFQKKTEENNKREQKENKFEIREKTTTKDREHYPNQTEENNKREEKENKLQIREKTAIKEQKNVEEEEDLDEDEEPNPVKVFKPRWDVSGHCRIQLVETIPATLVTHNFAEEMPVEHMTTMQAWLKLIQLTETKIEMVSQWGIGHKGKGAVFFKHLAKAVTDRGIKVRIVYTNKFKKNSYHTPTDLKNLAPDKVEIRIPSIERKIDGKTRGIIHSKIMVADKKHFYMGSANLGSRGASWTKEVGVLVTNCPELGSDASKLIQLYWDIHDMDTLPSKYPTHLSTKYGVTTPFQVLNPGDNTLYNVFLGSSPSALCATGRTDDLTAIINGIDKAEKYIYIAVGEYVPMDLFKQHKAWNQIDDRLRAAVRDRKVVLKYLGNDHASHKAWMKKNLLDLMKTFNKNKKMVEAKLYDADFRNFKGSHNKFMVTDKSAYIGTSNWSEDYFTTTAGVAFVFEPKVTKKSDGGGSPTAINLRDQLETIFMRDFNSPLAHDIDEEAKTNNKQ